MIFQSAHIAAPDLFGQPVDDLDAGQIAFVYGAIESLPRKRLLMDRPIGITIEKAAKLVFQLADPHPRAVDKNPGKLLIVQPGAALDRVHEMAFDRISFSKRDVIAALHHTRAAALSEKPFHRDSDIEIRI